MTEEGDARFRLFTRLLERPVTALMLFILIAVLGVVSYQRIPVMLMPPGISEPFMEVNVPYPGASPFEVWDNVVKPIEDEVRTLPYVEKVWSRAGSDSGRVGMRFNSKADMDEMYAELKDRLERVRATFPDGIDDLRIWRMNSDVELPIFWIGLLYDESVSDPFGVAKDIIQKRLDAVDGVAQVDVEGMVQDTLRVFVSPEKLRSHGVSIYDVVERLRRDNFTLPAGDIADGGREFTLRIDSTYRTIEEVRKYPIDENVLLEDIAEVALTKQYKDVVSRVNGKNALTAVISKESDKNTVDVCARVERQIAALEQDPRLRGFQFRVYFNQADLINGALDNLKTLMGWGAIFALLILYLFVRRLSMTLMVALAIPVSLLAALVAIHFTGFTLNIISLAGFTLAIGMLVDNSVVVAENVLRRQSDGLSPLAAAASGASQVGIAILLSTLTTIVVFLPMVFMAEGKQTRAFLGELAAPITFSLAASLLTALIFLPIAAVQLARWRKPGADPTGGHAVSAYRSGSPLMRGYRRALSYVLAHRFATVLVVLGVISAGQAAYENLDVVFAERRGGGGRIRVGVELPKRFTLAEAADVFKDLESFLLVRLPEYQVSDVSARFRRTGGRFYLWLDDDVPPKHDKDLTERLKEELPNYPGVRLQVGWDDDGEGSVQVRLHGPDSRTLAEISEDVVRELERVPTLSDVQSDVDDSSDELLISIDRARAQRFGVGQETLQGLISWGVGGQHLPSFRGFAREVPMVVEYEDPEVGDVNYLKSLDVPVDVEGGSVPLAALTQFRFERSSGSIRRTDGVTSLTITAQTFDDNSYRVNRRVAEVLEAYPFPEGYGWRDTGSRLDFERGRQETFTGLLVGCIFVFLLMGMLFESWILPLSVLLAIPMALVGASFGLFITNTPLDGIALLAFILLAGVVVNNGIVLVDRIRQVRLEGVPRRQAVLEGCAQRVRPVLMTALTTMFGLLPMAMPTVFATGEDGGINYKSLAIATLGGLTLSTLLTLLVVPLFYTLFDDLGAMLRRMVGLDPEPETRSDPEPLAARDPAA